MKATDTEARDDAAFQQVYNEAIAHGLTEAEASNYAAYDVGGEDIVFEEPSDDDAPETIYEDDGT